MVKLFTRTPTEAEEIATLEVAFSEPVEPAPDGVVRSLERERRRRAAGLAKHRAERALRTFTDRCALCGSASLPKNPAVIVRIPLAPWLDSSEASGKIESLTLCSAGAEAYRRTRPEDWPVTFWHGVLKEALTRSEHAGLVAPLGTGRDVAGNSGYEYWPSMLSDWSWLASAYRARRNGLPDPGDGTEWSHLAKAE